MIWRLILAWLLGISLARADYFDRHRTIITQDPLGRIAYYTNDGAHRLIASTDPLQRTARVAYDADSHQTNVTDAAGDRLRQFWNGRGNLVKAIDAATHIIGRTYDSVGNLIYLTNRDGHFWQFQYDGANRLTNTISPLGHSSSQVYNSSGLLQSSTDPLLRTTSFVFDGRHRLNSKTDNLGTLNYQYDGNNNLTLLTNAGGPGLSWVYDAYNRPTSFTNVVPASGGGALPYGIQYRYDANGNLTNLIYPGGLTVTYFYDSNNRLIDVMDWNGRQTTIGYDLAGHITEIARPNNTIRTMAYDDDGELTNIVEQTSTKFPVCFYTINYNSAGRIQWEFKGPLPHTNTPATRTMTYDNDNRLATFNSTSVMVDAAGNLIDGPGTNNTFGAYGYDPRNRLTNAGGINYGYDPANNRIFLTNGSVASEFVVEPRTSQALMRITGSVTNYYIYGPGLLYEVDVTPSGTSLAYYHYDCHGSTVALTDGNGNITDQMEYSPYGSITYRAGTTDTPFLYNGQFGVQTDPNGLLYMRARYYNPYISRFINADPSGFGGGLNFYAFCNNNPISLTDPFGLGAEANSSGYSWIGQVNYLNAPFLPSGPFQYVTGTGAASDLLSGAANTGAAVGNIGANVLGGVATVLNGANQFANYLLNPFGWDMQAVGAALPIVGAEESLVAEAGSLAAGEEMVTVTHFTDAQTVGNIQNGTGALNAGSFVTLPSEVAEMNLTRQP